MYDFLTLDSTSRSIKKATALCNDFLNRFQPHTLEPVYKKAASNDTALYLEFSI
jgi:hypothetical protein